MGSNRALQSSVAMELSLKQSIQTLLEANSFLIIWGVAVAITISLLVYDLRKNNPEIGSLMKFVWLLTVVYSGPLGLAAYWYSGRKQIRRDSLWRRAARSTAHCYSGCGVGEILGVILAAGILVLSNLWVAAITFTLAYIFGFGLTVGPLMEEGVGFDQAMKDAFYSETASITAMEITAIGTDLWLAGSASINESLFWSSLVLSLSLGFLAAYPVNAVLIKMGVKEGMHNPRDMARSASS